MRVWIVVHHYDRGSDEVRIEGVFSTLEKASDYLDDNFTGWRLSEEDAARIDEGDVIGMWFYEDLDDESSSDRVCIEQAEVL